MACGRGFDSPRFHHLRLRKGPFVSKAPSPPATWRLFHDVISGARRVHPGADFAISVGQVAGQILDHAGAKVAAVERGSEVIVEFEDGFVVQPQDAVFICGSINSLERCQREFRASTAQSPQGR